MAWQRRLGPVILCSRGSTRHAEWVVHNGIEYFAEKVLSAMREKFGGRVELPNGG
jgi:hypothetical protein